MRTVTNKIRIALAGGGTGGHIYPLVAVMGELRAQGSNMEFHYFGARDQFSQAVLEEGAILHRIAAGKLRRYFSLLNFLDIPKVIWSFVQAFWKLFWLMPDALFSKGGPGALPVVIAAWFYRIPVIIHESDVAPGLTNLLSAPFARRIALGFENSKRYFNPNKAVVTGNPVRASLLQNKKDQATAKEELDFSSERPLLVVIGGSQGAQTINEFVVVSLKDILPITQIFHQTGRNNFEDIQKLAKAAILEIPVETEAQSRYKSLPYFDDKTSGLALSAADLVVGRAGAGSITEFAAFGKPMILLPLAGHQEENAATVVAGGAAHIIEEENLTPQIFLTTIKSVLEHPEVQQKMSEAAKKFYDPKAAGAIAELILRSAV